MIRVSNTLLVAASIFAIACTTHAHAQERSDARQTPATGSEADDARKIADTTEEGITGAGAAEPVDKEEIVVTGTNIRGVVPTGANVVSVNRADIEAFGQSSTTQLLAQIPQLASFNTLPQISPGSGSGSAGLTNRPNARGLSDDLLDSVGNTLILIDGNRSSGVGTRQSSGDADGIPAALIERVEANLDGGSATYGSDAIGGVINFVTKRKFDGVQVSGHFGAADRYSNWDATIIAGKDWGSGGAYISYSHSQNESLLRSDRDYYRVLNYTTGLEIGTSCDAPNITALTGANASTGRIYAVNPDGTIKLTGGLPTAGTANAPVNGSPNLCTQGKQAAMYPEQSRHNVNAVVSQDLSDSVSLTVRGRWASNYALTYDVPFTGTAFIKPDNPYYQALTGTADAAANQSVSFSFGPAYGNQRPATNKYTQWGVNAELSAKLGDNWRARFVANFDKSNTRSFGPDYDTIALAAATQSASAPAGSPSASPCTTASAAWAALPAGSAKDQALATARASCINPYNVEASTPALLAAIANREVNNRSTDRILQFKAIVDGSLFELPAGPLKVAFGAEYFDDKIHLQKATGPIGGPYQTDAVGTRSNWSLFGEADIPIVSSANEMFAVKELRFSAQGRYDHFSNTGGIFNPKFGFSYKPVEWFKLRGNWGKSFRAPAAIDVISLTSSRFAIADLSLPQYTRLLNTALYPLVDSTLGNNIAIAYNPGYNPLLRPQSGTDWSIGGEFTPFPGFFASASYYHIDLKDPFVTPSTVVGIPTYVDFANYGPLPTTPGVSAGGPSQADIDAFIADTINKGEFASSIAGKKIYLLFDNRLTNLGASKASGIDYSVRYTSRTGFGSVSFSASGNIKLSSMSKSFATLPFTDGLITNPQSKHRITVTGGFTYGETLRGQITWNHSDGYDVPRSATLLQDHVGAFNVVNAYFSYNFQGDDAFRKDLQISLGINNILNASPPVYYSNGGVGTANGSTLGRQIQVGFQKKF